MSPIFSKILPNVFRLANSFLCNGNNAVGSSIWSYLFLIKCKALVKEYNKSYGSGSIHFVNNVNSQVLVVFLQSELMAAMNT